MGQINLSLPSDGQSIDAADVNSPFNTIANEINGNLDNSNIASNAAIAGSKLASGGVDTTQLADDSVTDDKLDYPRFWQEIGRTTLGSSGDTISVTSLPARKYLQILYFAYASSTIAPELQFNTDTGTNYTSRTSTNGGADSSVTNQDTIIVGTSSTSDQNGTFDVFNIAAKAKRVSGQVVVSDNTDAGSGRLEVIGVWANTSDQISSVQLVNTGAGSFDTGSEVVVLGHD